MCSLDKFCKRRSLVVRDLCSMRSLYCDNFGKNLPDHEAPKMLARDIENPMHRAVGLMLQRHGWPKNWKGLFFEFPTERSGVPGVSYYRNAEDLLRGRETKCKTARYLSRYWGEYVKPDVIRDVAQSSILGDFKFLYDPEEIVSAVRTGPESCQRWGYGDGYPSTLGDTWETHPYKAYAPEYGWCLAVMEVDGQVLSRALVHRDKRDGVSRFVQTYGLRYQLLDWLHAQNVVSARNWPAGAMLKAGDPWPYLDGWVQRARMKSLDTCAVDRWGPIVLNDPNGIAVLDLSEEPGDANQRAWEDFHGLKRFA